MKTFNRNKCNIYSTIKSSVNCLKNNSVSGFDNIKLYKVNINPPAPPPPPFFLKNLSKEEYGEVLCSIRYV